MRRTSSHAKRAAVLGALLCLLLAVPGNAPAEPAPVALVSRTVVDALTDETRVLEMAHMLGGDSESTRDMARELLQRGE